MLGHGHLRTNTIDRNQKHPLRYLGGVISGQDQGTDDPRSGVWVAVHKKRALSPWGCKAQESSPSKWL